MTNPAAVRRGPNRAVLRVLVLVTALAVAAGLMISATRSEAAPRDPITQSNLPWEADLEWQEPGDWKAAELYEGEGERQTTKCLQEPVVEMGEGLEGIYQRDFDYAGGTGKERGSALILEYETNQQADEIYGALARMAAIECHQELERQGYTPVGELTGHRISIPGTEARFTEMSYRAAEDDDQEEAYFESVGAVRDGNKIALVSMTMWGMDNNWSYEPDDGTGLPLHPMYRTMPKVADRLVG